VAYSQDIHTVQAQERKRQEASLRAHKGGGHAKIETGDQVFPCRVDTIVGDGTYICEILSGAARIPTGCKIPNCAPADSSLAFSVEDFVSVARKSPEPSLIITGSAGGGAVPLHLHAGDSDGGRGVDAMGASV